MIIKTKHNVSSTCPSICIATNFLDGIILNDSSIGRFSKLQYRVLFSDFFPKISCAKFPAIRSFSAYFCILFCIFFLWLVRIVLFKEFQKSIANGAQIGATTEIDHSFKNLISTLYNITNKSLWQRKCFRIRYC